MELSLLAFGLCRFEQRKNDDPDVHAKPTFDNPYGCLHVGDGKKLHRFCPDY